MGESDWITEEVPILFENGAFLWLSVSICKDLKLTVPGAAEANGLQAQ